MHQIWRGLVADEKHGSLPILMLLLTVVTGVVDAVSLLTLGRVFVANMTGNVVFIGFAIVDTPGYSLLASVAALLGFVAGALLSAPILKRRQGNRFHLMRDVMLVEGVLVLVALVIALFTDEPFSTGVATVIAAVLAVALGLQNATARKLAVPDLTSTVLTMTITGLGADRSSGPLVRTRRLLALLAMGGGAAVGALLVRHTHAWVGLLLAVALLVVVGAGAALSSDRHPEAR
ncbi:YoaK family protein [Flexivirga meconopsidis]|uniref:YoaK family protein n=1 Tax=Flexivirga meconopsidis TaxID=2977121 RepID=UPI00223EC995|nr:YoaK family protein [Flexivirga meconopsidis]